MINQIQPVKTQTEALPTINRDLLRIRRLSAKLRSGLNPQLETKSYLWRTETLGHIPTRVSSRIE